MSIVQPCPLPEGAFLAAYRERGAYTDCYATELPIAVSHAAYVTAFYTTAVFKLERLVLRFAIDRPSTDEEAARVADGGVDRFAAWDVEQRAADQVLMCDLHGRTRSWLMTRDVSVAGSPATRLYFGSAVVPMRDARTGSPSMGSAYRALLGFHRVYSIVLLRAARARLLRQSR